MNYILLTLLIVLVPLITAQQSCNTNQTPNLQVNATYTSVAQTPIFRLGNIIFDHVQVTYNSSNGTIVCDSASVTTNGTCLWATVTITENGTNVVLNTLPSSNCQTLFSQFNISSIAFFWSTPLQCSNGNASLVIIPTPTPLASFSATPYQILLPTNSNVSVVQVTYNTTNGSMCEAATLNQNSTCLWIRVNTTLNVTQLELHTKPNCQITGTITKVSIFGTFVVTTTASPTAPPAQNGTTVSPVNTTTAAPGSTTTAAPGSTTTGAPGATSTTPAPTSDATILSVLIPDTVLMTMLILLFL